LPNVSSHFPFTSFTSNHAVYIVLTPLVTVSIAARILVALLSAHINARAQKRNPFTQISSREATQIDDRIRINDKKEKTLLLLK